MERKGWARGLNCTRGKEGRRDACACVHVCARVGSEVGVGGGGAAGSFPPSGEVSEGSGGACAEERGKVGA